MNDRERLPVPAKEVQHFHSAPFKIFGLGMLGGFGHLVE